MFSKNVYKTICVILLLGYNLGHSQISFNWSYSPKNIAIEGDQVTIFAIDVDQDKSIYCAGQFDKIMDVDPSSDTVHLTSYASLDICLIKYDSIGNLLWAFNLEGGGVDKPTSLKLDHNGDIIISGRFQNKLDFDPSNNNFILDAGPEDDNFLAKYSSDGSFIWAVNFGNNEDMFDNKITIDYDNNIYIAGTFLDTIVDLDPTLNYYWLENSGTKSAYLTKFNSLGNIMWAFSDYAMYSNSYTQSTSIEIDNNENIWVVGYFKGTVDFNPNFDSTLVTSSGTGYSAFFSVYSKDGNLKFVKSFTSSNLINVADISIDSLNNAFIVGNFQGIADFDPSSNVYSDTSMISGYTDVYVSKFDSLGQFIWNKSMKDAGGDWVETITANTSELLIGGSYADYINADPINGPIYLTSMSTVDGSLNWHKQTYCDGYAWTHDIVRTDNSITIGGKIGDSVYFNPPMDGLLESASLSNNAGFIATYDISGSYLFANQIGNYSNDEVADERIKAFDIKSNGNIVLTGSFTYHFSADPTNSANQLSTNYETDIFLIEITPIGEVVWSKDLGSLMDDAPNSLIVDSNDNIYLSGTFQDDIDFDSTGTFPQIINQGNLDAFFIKLDSDGNLVWAKTVNGPGYQDFYMTKSNDNYIYASGKFFNETDFDPSSASFLIDGGVSSSLFMAKYSLEGNLIWAKKIIPGNNSTISKPLIISDTLIVFTGGYTFNPDFDPGPGTAYGNSSSAYSKLYVVDYDTSGNFNSLFTLYDDEAMVGHSVLLDENGNQYLSGAFFGTCNFNPNGTPYSLSCPDISLGASSFLAKYDSNDSLIFVESIWPSNLYVQSRLYFDPNDNIIQLGNFAFSADFDPGPNTDILTTKGGIGVFIQSYDTTGTYLWSKVIDGFGDDRGSQLAFIDSGSFIVSAEYTFTTDLDPTNDVYYETSLNGYNFYVASYSYCSPDLDSTVITSCVPVTINGQTMVSTGVHKIFDTNIFGCDSNMIVSFTNNTSFSSLAESQCFSYLSPSGNFLWFDSGVYTDTLINYLGCDSIITIHLLINNSDTILNKESCDTYLSPAGYTYTTSGTYTEVIPNSAGCDSTITINLNITNVDVSTSLNSFDITANNTAATNYQWVNCDNGFAEIAGETNQTFSATVNGNYAVVVAENGCSDTSACVNISGLSIGVNENNLFAIYPNPVSHELTISLNENFNAEQILILDYEGKIVHQINGVHQSVIVIDVTNFAAGIYTINLISNDHVNYLKLIKL